MSAALTPAAWLTHLVDSDRTLDYIASGGSVVRIAVAPDRRTHRELAARLQESARSSALRYLAVVAPEVLVYQPEHVLRALAKRVDLRQLLTDYAANSWSALGYQSDGVSLRSVADSSGEEMTSLRRELSSHMRTELRAESALTRDFRDAMQRTVLELVSGSAVYASSLMESWLDGTISRRDRQELGVHRPVRRVNATPTIRSLLAAVHLAGHAGTIVHLDARWITDHEQLDGSPRPPTRSHRVWMYQWMRELIDSMPQFRSSFVCVEVGESFLNEEITGRGMGLYDALRIRIVDGVRPRGGQNPSAPLLVLGGET